MRNSTVHLSALDSENTILLSTQPLEEEHTKEEIEYLLDYCSDVGIRKKVNQDACCVRILKIPSHTIVLAVVCDGVGGMVEGEYASHNTVLAFHNWFDYTLSKKAVDVPEGDELFDFLIADMKALIIQQNEAVYSYAGERGIQTGTTLTAMLFVDDDYFIAQIGDSRAYQVVDQVLQLTEDQSFVAKEVKAGRMTKEEAKRDRRRNIILQCLGATAFIEPVYLTGKVKKDAVYFLCSDGFVHELEEFEIEQIMNPHNMCDLNQAHECLLSGIEVVKTRGETDNITVVLVRT